MWFKRMTLEEWFDTYQYKTEYDIGESAVKFLTFEDLNLDLGRLPLRYGYHAGRPDLRECIAGQYPGLTADQVLVTSGGSEANFAIIAAVAKPGDHVVIEHPNYTSLYDVPRSLGCEVTLFHLNFEEQFIPDLDTLHDMILPYTRIVSFTHPNNPTGSMISESDLMKLIEIVESHDTYLLFDETYRDMTFDKTLPPAATLSPKVISLSSMSKCYGLPGIRIGWLATQDKFILDTVLAIREQVSITNNAISEEIALQVLQRKDEFLQRAERHIAKNRSIVAGWMEGQQDFEWIYPEAGVVSLPRIKDPGDTDPEKVWRRLAEKYKTFIVPGRCFEMDNRHFRLGFGAMPEEIKTGLDNLQKALRDER